MPPRGRRTTTTTQKAESYRHTEADSPLRPDVGTQAQFRKKKPPVTYRYDSSLSPVLDWDGQNPAREQGEALIREILEAKTIEQAKAAAEKLKQLSKPFLNWTGKAERLSFEVPTLPLFVHERLSTKGIIETLTGHRKDKGAEQLGMFELFGDPQRPVTDQVLKAYEYRDKWVNRMILGDSLVTMNSLLHYEGMGGQVQMIYFDPPYGIKFGSNFQPFIRKRDITHNEDEDMTREPEMVKAYRDTWELGLHSYLTYLRDRLLLSRELLTESGSIFVQISDENLHHVREVMDEVFGAENFVTQIAVKRPSMARLIIRNNFYYLLWYAKIKDRVRSRKVFIERQQDELPGFEKKSLGMESKDGLTTKEVTPEDRDNFKTLSKEWRFYQLDNLVAIGGSDSSRFDFEYKGKKYSPGNKGWKVSKEGMEKLSAENRLEARGETLCYKNYLDDFPVVEIGNLWDDTAGPNKEVIYAVQTKDIVVQRCMLMTTDPGDLVLDPTCGSGTTAYTAEQWGRRWITIDTSRVPLALARQRLLTATFPYYELKDTERGPAGGFSYKRKQNKKGEEVGGIVPHVTLGSIANNEPPAEEILVDRPDVVNGITRVTGPFCVEATIPTPVEMEEDTGDDVGAIRRVAQEGQGSALPLQENHSSFVDRMLEVLRKSPVIHVGGGKTIAFKNLRLPAKTLSLSAEAVVVNGKPHPLPEGEGEKAVALVFGPENGAVSEKLVHEALKEANLKGYAHLYIIGFAIQPNARTLIENSTEMGMIPATYVQATPDLMMGDLLKNMRSSQIFSVCGLPEVKIHKASGQPAKGEGDKTYQVELLGFDVFDPITMEVDHRKGDDVPAWLLDTDYNGLCFHVTQAFFPRTSAWDNLKRALRGTYDESVWDHLAGTKSAPFEAGEHGQIAVKVIDDRGNELMVVKSLKEAGK